MARHVVGGRESSVTATEMVKGPTKTWAKVAMKALQTVAKEQEMVAKEQEMVEKEQEMVAKMVAKEQNMAAKEKILVSFARFMAHLNSSSESVNPT